MGMVMADEPNPKTFLVPDVKKENGGEVPVDGTIRRLELSCATLGFAPPPVPLNLKFVQGVNYWTVLVRGPEGRFGQISRWIEQYRPSSVRTSFDQSSKLVRATFTVLPRAWEKLVLAFQVHDLQLTPMGHATLSIQGVHDGVDAFTMLAELESRSRTGILADRTRVRPLLTPRQHEALCTAVALGYYKIPRPLNLRGLAQRMSISPGALSELLRRAEAHVIRQYVDSQPPTVTPGPTPPPEGPEASPGFRKLFR